MSRDLGLAHAAARRAARRGGHHTLAAGLADLAAADRAVRDSIAARDAIARLLLDRDQASYREIGIALGITRQAAAERYPDAGTRLPGGQPGELR